MKFTREPEYGKGDDKTLKRLYPKSYAQYQMLKTGVRFNSGAAKNLILNSIGSNGVTWSKDKYNYSLTKAQFINNLHYNLISLA